MRLTENSTAKDFNMKDVDGNLLSLKQFKGRKVLLSFMRYTGCPVCNLHVHELLVRKEEIEKKDLVIIFIFESSIATIKKYIKNQNLPFTFVSDTDQKLYQMYSVEKSWIKLFRLFFSFRGLSDCIKGLLKFNKFSSMKGSTNRVGAEFLINEKGILEKVYYGKIVGDHMPISFYL